MGETIDRRQWIKTSALALAGLMTGPGLGACGKGVSYPQNESGHNSSILLNNNESPFGISPNAAKAITASMDLSNRYPHRSYSRLIDLIAERENVPADHIILGAGSTDVMVTLIHMAKPGGEILAADPTYFDFVYYARSADRMLNQVKLNHRFEHDVEAMEKQISPRTELIYMCNPNNPTGSITPKNKLLPFCERASKRALVVVDEAYHEYTHNESYSSMIDLVRRGKNIIVTRTFSKIFGLAGLRIGYGMAPPHVIAKLEKLSRNFAPVAWLSLEAAIASYIDKSFIQSVKGKNGQAKTFLYEELDKRGLFTVPSQTNFILFRVDQEAKTLAGRLEEEKIFVRSFRFDDKQWLRVSCGTRDELQAFLHSLDKTI